MDAEEVWRIREDVVYPKLFGGTARGIFTLDDAVFRTLGQEEFDPLWFFFGVWEFAPTQDRSCWIYATSGLSNPWSWGEDSKTEAEIASDEISGFGMEFLFATPQQGNWAIRYLQTILAYDLLLFGDCYPGRGPLGPQNRVSFNAPINHDPECALTAAVISRAQTLPSGFVLPSGDVQFFTVTGITGDELKFAQANDTATLTDRLAAAGAYPVTDPARRSIPLPV